MTLTDLNALLAPAFLLIWATVLLLVDLWLPPQRKSLTPALAALGLLITLIITVSQSSADQTAFHGMAVVDGFTRVLDVIFLLLGIGAIGMAYEYLQRMKIERGEYYTLMLFSLSGMILMTMANDLLIVFLALELLSIPLYVMAGFATHRRESEEAAFKYFILGTFAAAFLLFGIALMFGATGRTDLPGIFAANVSGVFKVMFQVAAAFILVSFTFKIAIAPFHGWAPDVYQGAPSPATGFMAVGAKAAGIAALVRVFIVAFPSLAENMVPVLWALAALTMLVGNITALAQSNIKRMLGYSSIAHGGYLLMAFVPYGQTSVQQNSINAILFYLLAYALTNLAAWSVIIAREEPEGKGLEISDFAGLAKSHPTMALAMAIAMFSFTGVPITLGFWGKFYLFGTVLSGGFPILAVLGLLSSVVSAFYYLRVIVMMYMRPGEPKVSRDNWLEVVALTSAILVLLLGLFPNLVVNFVSRASILIQ